MTWTTNRVINIIFPPLRKPNLTLMRLINRIYFCSQWVTNLLSKSMRCLALQYGVLKHIVCHCQFLSVTLILPYQNNWNNKRYIEAILTSETTISFNEFKNKEIFYLSFVYYLHVLILNCRMNFKRTKIIRWKVHVLI